MISRHSYYELGFKRQWMATPWLALTREGESGSGLTGLESALPAVDDLDPLQYHVFIAILPELQHELDNSQGVRTDGRGGVQPLDRPSRVNSGEIACPAGYEKQSVGNAGGVLCTDGTNAWGPFTEAMVEKCIQWGGGVQACRSDRWSLRLAERARGTGQCAIGASFDSALRYCVEGDDAFGPFPESMVARCITAGGGETTCRSARWSRQFLGSLLR